jgi:hypothetical protein
MEENGQTYFGSEGEIPVVDKERYEQSLEAAVGRDKMEAFRRRLVKAEDAAFLGGDKGIRDLLRDERERLSLERRVKDPRAL